MCLSCHQRPLKQMCGKHVLQKILWFTNPTTKILEQEGILRNSTFMLCVFEKEKEQFFPFNIGIWSLLSGLGGAMSATKITKGRYFRNTTNFLGNVSRILILHSDNYLIQEKPIPALKRDHSTLNK
jgi:hypothetical protein